MLRGSAGWFSYRAGAEVFGSASVYQCQYAWCATVAAVAWKNNVFTTSPSERVGGHVLEKLDAIRRCSAARYRAAMEGRGFVATDVSPRSTAHNNGRENPCNC